VHGGWRAIARGGERWGAHVAQVAARRGVRDQPHVDLVLPRRPELRRHRALDGHAQPLGRLLRGDARVGHASPVGHEPRLGVALGRAVRDVARARRVAHDLLDTGRERAQRLGVLAHDAHLDRLLPPAGAALRAGAPGGAGDVRGLAGYLLDDLLGAALAVVLVVHHDDDAAEAGVARLGADRVAAAAHVAAHAGGGQVVLDLGDGAQ